ncbi:TIGR02587 family membrane protein [Rhizobium sp. SSA_523]|uniref:TIGR02587 family membrane protein n=1 Tax=Rhizobium sp. SSA_523 TaxID=2952477 RepID=UPI002090EF7B|nr:TIGR02587 family membrane protein [Rhizobium sp. SSA_523]MCO5733262.1 TIGR02587 family membrane protein [Rhizobium sp. SSA_523]WKC21752.1 TIGR02587 family membrane protein [Rhizobium sp. SSA_523]
MAKRDHREFEIGLLRGAAGALIFGLPMLMTMELWFIGFYMPRERLFLLLLVNIPLLVVLARRIGFETTFTWREAFRDAMIAYALAILTSGLVLGLFGVLTTDMPIREWLGKTAIQAVPASIGAMLGRSQFGKRDEEAEDEEKSDEMSTGYAGELFMMAVGALFLCLNVAPTEEVILISYKMTAWHAVAAIVTSLAIMHGFVYAVSFRGTHELKPDTPSWHALIRFTFPGYIVACVISLYVLWTFGRLTDTSMTQAMMSMVVLNVPGALGAASARLVL